ncbi:hypothetical protein GCM10022248_54640 [Nonomuraea soli]
MDEVLTTEVKPVVASHRAVHTRCTSGISPATALKMSPTRRESSPWDTIGEAVAVEGSHCLIDHPPEPGQV